MKADTAAIAIVRLLAKKYYIKKKVFILYIDKILVLSFVYIDLK